MVRPRHTVGAALGLALVSALYLAACGGGAEEPDELSWVRLQTWGNAPAPEGDHVTRTEAEWQQTWAHFNGGAQPLPQRPAVDFTQRMVVGANRGVGPSGCWSLRITRVAEEALRVRVSYRITRPGPTDACTMQVVPLQDLVVIPRVNKQVVFAEVSN